MRKLLFITLLLCSAGLSAQEDSFMVEGKVFRFEIPQDWVLEVNVDSLFEDEAWSIIMRHPVRSKRCQASIFVSIRKNYAKKAPAKKVKEAPHTTYTDTTSYLTEYALIYFTKNTRYNITPLNDSTDLVFALFSDVPEKVQDTIVKTYQSFIDSFKLQNKPQLLSFTPLTLFEADNISSFSVHTRAYKYTIPKNWQSHLLISLDSTTSGVNLNTQANYCTSISYGIEISENLPPYYTPSDQPIQSPTIQSYPARSEEIKDTILGHRVTYLVTRKPSCNQRFVNETIHCYIKSRNGDYFLFSMSISTDSQPMLDLYKQGFNSFIRQFVVRNDF